MNYLDAVDFNRPDFGDWFDELPLWSAHFGLLLLERIPMKAGSRIVDVGAGTGFLTVELAQRCGPKSEVIAVDPWVAAMERLRRKVEYLGLTNVRLLVQDAAALDVAPESIDTVVSSLGFNNFADADAVIAACFRASKRGATLHAATNVTGTMGEFYDVFGAALCEVGRPERLEQLEAHVNHRGTIESVVGQLERAGFKAVRAESSKFRWRFADGSALLRHFFIRLGFLDSWKAIAPPDAIPETFAALERRLNAAAASRGELVLSIPSACIEARKP